MQRVIYSLYIDIPVEEHYGDSKIKFDSQDHSILIIEPQYDGDPGFDIEIIGKMIAGTMNPNSETCSFLIV